MMLQALVLLMPAFVSTIGTVCNVSLTWYMDGSNVAGDQLQGLLQCPELSHCCKGLPGPVTPADTVTCSCARNCAVYGDCCWDATLGDRRYSGPKPRSSCMVVEHETVLKSLHVVTGCVNTWPQDEVRDACENARDYSGTFYVIPATSSLGITYFNGFCAHCNYDVEDVIFWNASRSEVNDTIHIALPEIISQDREAHLRECDTENRLTDTCGLLTNQEWVRNCELYLAPVMDVSGTPVAIYKNVYCALCNGMQLPNLTCALMTYGGSTKPQTGSYSPNLVELFRPVTSGKNCLYSQDGKCYIPSAEYRCGNGTCLRRNGSILDQDLVGPIPIPCKLQCYVTITCITISLVCLFLKMIVYALCKASRGFTSKCTLCLSATLFFSHLTFLLANSFRLPRTLCITFAVVLHYGFLTTFLWTAVLAFDIWKGIASSKPTRERPRRIFVKYCIIAWCSPLCLVLVCACIEWGAPSSPLAPRYGQTSCWLSNVGAEAVFFLMPMAILVLLNAVLYLHIVAHVRRTVKRASSFEFRSRRERSHILLFVRLGFIMGATWALGFLSAFVESVVIDVAVIVLIGLEGVYLFVAFKDYRYLCSLFPSRKAPVQTTSSTAVSQ